MRQAYFSGVTKKGNASWIGGDAWFGSVSTALALKIQEVTHHEDDTGAETVKPLDVEFSFVMKNNAALFPRKILLEILKVRCGKQHVGKWAVMSATIKGVDLLAIGHCWSDRDCLLYTSPSPRDLSTSRMPSSA